MDSKHRVRKATRQFFDKVMIYLSELFFQIGASLQPETGIDLDIQCAHCSFPNSLGRLAEFGKVYEIECSQCKGLFTAVIPEISVTKGKIEAALDAH